MNKIFLLTNKGFLCSLCSAFVLSREEDLEFVKKYKILPLLEEYFYGDDENFNVLKEIVNENLDE